MTTVRCDYQLTPTFFFMHDSLINIFLLCQIDNWFLMSSQPQRLYLLCQANASTKPSQRVFHLGNLITLPCDVHTPESEEETKTDPTKYIFNPLCLRPWVNKTRSACSRLYSISGTIFCMYTQTAHMCRNIDKKKK